MNKFTVARNGEEIGTYSAVEIEHLVTAGYLNREDHYWGDGMEAWERLSVLVPERQELVLVPERAATKFRFQQPPPPQIAPAPMQPPPVVVHVVNNVTQTMPVQRTIIIGSRKSGFVAGFLNLLIPGLGYMYCGRFLLGVAAFILTVAVIVGSAGAGALVMYPLVFIDGFLCAGRANRNILIA